MATPNPVDTNDQTRRISEQAKARPAADQSPGNVDKIRDILFGSQMRDYEVRFSRLEESLMKEASDLRETTRKRFESLEQYLRKELESLEARLKSERDERADAQKQLARELKALNDALSKKLEDLSDQTVQNERQLRKDLLQQSQQLTEEIRTKTDALTALLDRRILELRNSKADRSALADLFTEVALRLNNEFQIPGAME